MLIQCGEVRRPGEKGLCEVECSRIPAPCFSLLWWNSTFFICFCLHLHSFERPSPSRSMVKNLPANAGDTRDVGSTPGMGRSPGEGDGNSLHYSCLENPIDRGAWWATVHGVWHDWVTEWLSNVYVSMLLSQFDPLRYPTVIEIRQGFVGVYAAAQGSESKKQVPLPAS